LFLIFQLFTNNLVTRSATTECDDTGVENGHAGLDHVHCVDVPDQQDSKTIFILRYVHHPTNILDDGNLNLGLKIN